MKSIISSFHHFSSEPYSEFFEMHTHNDHEIFCFLSGNADYFVEGNVYTLNAGDIMLMRKGESHTLILKSNAPYERMVINFELDRGECFGLKDELMSPFEARQLGQYNQYKASLFPDSNRLFYIKRICDSVTDEEKLLYLLPLLKEISEQSCNVKEDNSGDSAATVTLVIQYINRHITDELSLQMLSERFFISRIHLNRLFKSFTGTTVWDYITVKRLFLAKELIKKGICAADACKRCGFNDYSSFYRAYKKRFGATPKQDSRQ